MERSGFRTIADSDQDVTCRSALPGRPTFCFASDGGTTSVWQVDGTALTPIGTLTGDVTMSEITPSGEIAAWRSSQRFLIDPERRSAVVLPRMGSRYTYWMAWTSVESIVGSLVSDEDDRVWIRTFARQSPATLSAAAPSQ